MKIKVAIIDTLGAHGGSFHFYTFGQSMGLINEGVAVSLYTNNETSNPKIEGLKFFSFYNEIFANRSQIKNSKKLIVILNGAILASLCALIYIGIYRVVDKTGRTNSSKSNKSNHGLEVWLSREGRLPPPPPWINVGGVLILPDHHTTTFSLTAVAQNHRITASIFI